MSKHENANSFSALSVGLPPGAHFAYDFSPTLNLNKSLHSNTIFRSSYRPVNNLSLNSYTVFNFTFIKVLQIELRWKNRNFDVPYI
jgi:hypothetical protein